MASTVKNRKRNTNFIQRFLRSLQQDWDAIEEREQQRAEAPHSLVEDHDTVIIDAWGEVYFHCNDPSSLSRRVSLIR